MATTTEAPWSRSQSGGGACKTMGTCFRWEQSILGPSGTAVRISSKSDKWILTLQQKVRKVWGGGALLLQEGSPGPSHVASLMHENVEKSAFCARPQAVLGQLFRHNECVQDLILCKGNAEEKMKFTWPQYIPPSLLKIAFALLLPLDIFLPITKSHKEPASVLCVCAPSALRRRRRWLRLCLRARCTCASSAAVTWNCGGGAEHERKSLFLTLFKLLERQNATKTRRWKQSRLWKNCSFCWETESADMKMETGHWLQDEYGATFGFLLTNHIHKN